MTYLQTELKKLLKNDRQREAYVCNESCVVLAGPGSGKTATLALKVIRLLTNDIPPPRGLACITFNNEAVREFSNRLRRLGLQPRTNVFLGTVHSFCLSSVVVPFGKLFRSDLPSPMRVAPDDVRQLCLEKAMDKIGTSESPSGFQTRFDRYRRTHLDRTSTNWREDKDCAEAIEHYETLLRGKGYIDFDDLILISLNLIESEPFVRQCIAAHYPWFVVDEYQDLGYPLHRIILTLLDKADVNLFAVGDPDQSIYGFAGANPQYLHELSSRTDMASIRLELNYRCGQKIIDGAEVILSPEAPRNYKSSREDGDPGEIYFVERPGGLEEQALTVVEEILPLVWDAGYEPRETAILYIDRYDAAVISKALDDRAIKYAGVQDQRYKRTRVTRWLEECAQWCCGTGGKDAVRFKDISDFWIGLLRRTGVQLLDEYLLEHLRTFFAAICSLRNHEMALSDWLNSLDLNLSLRDRLRSWQEAPEEAEACDSLFSVCCDGHPLEGFALADLAGCGPNSNIVSLTTLHSSKGLEFDVVVILGLDEGRLPSWGAQSPLALKEARRTFYVGFTRARHLVYLLYSGWYQNRWGRRFKNGPSRFILELQEALGVQPAQ